LLSFRTWRGAAAPETPPYLAKLFSLADARKKHEANRERDRELDLMGDAILIWAELFPAKHRDQCIQEMCRTFYRKLPDADTGTPPS